MTKKDEGSPRSSSRREFVSNVGLLASTAVIAGCASTSQAAVTQTPALKSADWDLSWTKAVRTATDSAVFDWPSAGDPADPIVLEMAERYLDNCRSAYPAGTYTAQVVLNVRTQAIGAAMTDALWEKYSLGASYNIMDPNTKQPATQNPFWHRAPDPAPGIKLPTMEDMVNRGAIVLVCDFAMGHLSNRLAAKTGQTAEAVHRDLRAGLIRNAYAVPSGIFGLARAQNSGCAYVRV
jgi:hypothetical protein